MIIIQITAGREYTDDETIRNAIDAEVNTHGARNIIIRHGNARGGDRKAHLQALLLGIPKENIQSRPVEYYGYSWERDGLNAGNLRNAAMLDEEPQPDKVLAFPDPQSRGTWNMVRLAEERGIPTDVHEQFEDSNR